MPSSKPIRSPWWLKPMNKVFIQTSRLGMSFGGEGPAVLTVDGKRYVVGGLPRADWVQNTRAAEHATLTRSDRPEEFESLAGRCAVFCLEPF